jgi:hypothetical protein
VDEYPLEIKHCNMAIDFSPIFGMIFPDPIAMFEYVFFLMPALHDLAVNDKATSQHWLRT